MRHSRLLILALAAGSCGYGQTRVHLETQAKAIDFANSSSTRPVKTGTVLPAVCAPGELFFKRDAVPGQNLYGCTAANAWIAQASGDGGGVAPANHAAQHMSGGTDPLASAIPAANAIPYADSGGHLDAWLSVSARSFTFPASATWNVTGSSHLLATCDLAFVARDASGNGIWPNSFSCNPSSFDISVGWATNQAGRLSLVRSGGSGGGGGGGGGMWGAITGNLSDQTDLQGVLDGKSASAHTHGASDVVSGSFAPARLAGGVPDISKYLRGDGTWAAVAGTAANPAGNSGQVQINESGVFGGRVVGTGLTMDSLNLGVDTSVVATLGDVQTVTANKTFAGQVQVTGPAAVLDATGATASRPMKVVTADPSGVCTDGEMAVKANGQRFVCNSTAWMPADLVRSGTSEATCNAGNLGLTFLNTSANPTVLKICGKNSSGSYAWGTTTVAGW